MVAAAAAASTVLALEEPAGARPAAAPAPAPTGYERWSARMERPLLVASLLFVVVLVLPVLVTDLPPLARTALKVANVGIWLFFTVDYLGRLRLAEDRRHFVRTHVLDLVVVLVPFFRPLRLARLLTVAGRVGQSRGAVVADVTKLVTAAAVVTAFLGAVLGLDAERTAPETTIANFRDALWWALGTMTAVPYGDVYPVTQEGRLVSAALMVLGLVFVGIITAAIAAWFVQYIGHPDEEEVSAELVDVQARLVAIEALLLELTAGGLPRQRTGSEGAGGS